MTARSGKTIERQASLWVARHSLGPLTQEHAGEFDRWCASDPAHGAAFSRMSTALERFDRAGPVIRGAHERALKIERRRKRIAAGSLATLSLLAVTIGLTVDIPARFADIRTGRGEVRELALADGSRLWLDADSAVNVSIDSQSRVVTLVRGRLHVDVVHERRRFDVRSGTGTVRDVGTGFDVSREGGISRTLVTDGVVNAMIPGKTLVLRAGQGASWGDDDGLHPSRPNSDAATWREGRVTFASEPLAKVIATLDRYSRRRLILLNADAGKRLVSGVVRTRQAEADIAALARSQGLNTTDIGVAILLD